MTRTFVTLGIPPFRMLWLSAFGRDFAEGAVVILIAWLTYDLTSSRLALGAVGLAATIPTMLVGSMAGVIADWYDRRRLLLTAHLGASLTMSIPALLIASQRLEVWHLLVVAAVMGSLRPLVVPARTALVPTLIPEGQLTNAVALVELGAGAARLGGPVAAGFMLALAGPGWGFGGASAMFLAAWYLAIRMRTPLQATVERKSPRFAIRALIEAATHAWRNSAIRWVVILALVFSAFAQSPLKEVLPDLTEDVSELGAVGLGMLFVAVGVGGLVGALVLATLNPNRRSLILVRIMVATGTLLIVLSLSDLFPLTVVLLALLGAAMSGFSIARTTALLAGTPVDMRGRIMGLMSSQWLLVAIPIAWAAAGLDAIANTLSISLGILMYGAVCVVIGVVVLRFVPAIRGIG